MITKTTRGFIAIPFILFCITAYGQQRFLNNQRMWNDMMFNPAKIVETNGLAIYANHRQQYYTLGSQSPYLFLIGGKGNLRQHYSPNMLYSESRKKTIYNYALGGYYIHSFTGGVYDQNEICGQFGLQVKLNQTLNNPSVFDQFNIGLAIKGINNRYRGNAVYNLYDQYDPTFTNLQISNKYAISVIPGIQYSNSNVSIDALYTFGPKDQTFGSLTIMGGAGLNGYFKQMALRVSYFGNPNCQLAINKIQQLGWGWNQSWALNYGVNVFLGKKFVSSSSIATNPGLYVGLLYSNIAKSKKYSKKLNNKKRPEWFNVFSGSLNLVDANLNTLPLGPSAEMGLMYQHNSKICDCDRLYDKFLTIENNNSLAEMKSIYADFKSKCDKDVYRSAYITHSDYMKKTIDKKDQKINGTQPVEAELCIIDKQKWDCKNFDQIGKSSIKLVSNEEEWKKLSPNQACCCYYNFNEKNKGYGVFYNVLALKNIMVYLQSENSDYNDFRIATYNDWEILMEYAINKNSVDNLYNCDGKSRSTLNLFSTGYYEEGGWMEQEDGDMIYWTDKTNIVQLSCVSRGELMPHEIDSDQSKYGAYLIRLIKKSNN